MIVDFKHYGVNAKPLTADIPGRELGIEDETAIEGSVRFDGELSVVNDRATLNGRITGQASVECRRCLAPVGMPIDVEFTDHFKIGEASAEAESELADDDLDDELIFEPRIDLNDVVREQIILALPDMVFCKEDCKGLCPVCSANKNLKDCGCETVEVDPRWAALKDIGKG